MSNWINSRKNPKKAMRCMTFRKESLGGFAHFSPFFVKVIGKDVLYVEQHIGGESISAMIFHHREGQKPKVEVIANDVKPIPEVAMKRLVMLRYQESGKSLRFNGKLERLKNAKARKLTIPYESLKRQFGDSLSAMTDELAAYIGMDIDFLKLLMMQKFGEPGKGLITHSGISFEEIDDFFAKKIAAIESYCFQRGGIST